MADESGALLKVLTDRRSVRALLVAVAIACGLAAGCGTTEIQRVPASDETRFVQDLNLPEFREDGSVSRADIRGQIGSPFAAYEGGRIVIYALRKRHGQFELASGPGATSFPADYRLVLVFRADDTLERWSLVNRGQKR